MVFPSQGNCSADVSLFLKRANGLETICQGTLGCLVLYSQPVLSPTHPLSSALGTNGYSLLRFRGPFPCFYLATLREISVLLWFIGMRNKALQKCRKSSSEEMAKLGIKEQWAPGFLAQDGQEQSLWNQTIEELWLKASSYIGTPSTVPDVSQR